ncbi:Ubiquitin carboxyl-terminal hydrolase 24 [Amphibalanus amphitrite]|uniref:Ubiquitin carboxyl-terminal hydrolase 24 n=1 Tax=Amphibalanus amphitrite TaxID=1232801 RepID=A0A6A4X136_AMPAM|nr:Ubiquitin carboxyl-terminal hydrolase 24 [Amphibalanus amphitrite]
MIALKAHGYHGGTAEDRDVRELLSALVEKHFPDSIRTCSQYFSLLLEYANMGSAQCDHLLSLDLFPRLVSFLIGPAGAAPRWTVSQTRQLGDLHSLLARLVLARLPAPLPVDPSSPLSSLPSSPLSSEDPGAAERPATPLPPRVDSASAAVETPEGLLYGPRADDYVREVITALRDTSWRPELVVRLLVTASREQRRFSERLVTAIMRSFGSIPCNELRHLSLTLGELVSLEDSCQRQRLDIILEGVPAQEPAEPVEGMLGMIRLTSGANSRRAYQCIKFLVSAAARSGGLKARLLSATERWLWAIQWLRSQMTELGELWDAPDSAAADSNDDSSGRMFRRTTSAQMTLDECSRLFTVEDAEMEIVSGGGDVN